MNCEEARKYIYPMLDNELDTETNLEVLSHLNMCESCQERLEVEKSFQNQLSGALSGKSVPDDTRGLIEEELAEARGNHSFFRRLQSGINRVLPAAAAVLLFVAAGMVVYSGIGLNGGDRSGEILSTMPAYHEKLMQSNKHHYEQQVSTQSFLTQERVQKQLAGRFRSLNKEVRIPSLDEKQCKILDGGLDADSWNQFGAPYYYVVYCYQPGENAQYGITHLAVKQSAPRTAISFGKKEDGRVKRKGDLHYIQKDNGKLNTVFWGDQTYTFALMSDQVSLDKLLELAEYAKKKRRPETPGKKATLQPIENNDF